MASTQSPTFILSESPRRRRREFGVGLDLDQGQVVPGIAPDDLRVERLARRPGSSTVIVAAPSITCWLVRM